MSLTYFKKQIAGMIPYESFVWLDFFISLPRRIKYLLISLFVVTILCGVIEPVVVSSVRNLMTSIGEGALSSSLEEIAVPIWSRSSVKLAFLKASLVLFACSLLNSILVLSSNLFSSRISVHIETRIIHSFSRLLLERDSQLTTSDALITISNRIDRLKDTIIGLFAAFASLCIGLSVFLALSLINLQFILLPIGLIIAAYISFYLLIRNPLNSNSEKIALYRGTRMDLAQDYIASYKELSLLNLDSVTLSEFRQSSKNLRFAEALTDILAQIPKPWIEKYAVLILILTGIITSSSIVDFISGLGILAYGLQKITTSIQQIYSGVSAYNINRFENKKTLEVLSSNKHLFINGLKEVKTDEFKNLEISEILIEPTGSTLIGPRGQSINFKPLFYEGDKVIITGPSGCGKSSFVDSIFGFSALWKIKLSINARSASGKKSHISDLNKIKHFLAYVPQTPHIFNSSIFSNITFADSSGCYDKESLKLSLYITGLETVFDPEFIKHKKIGENGKLLSGGQRQRVALARAIYSKKKIIFLDEATSSIDQKEAHLIVSRMLTNLPKTTFFVISHDVTMRSQFSRSIDLE